jgi:hypothetical protein
MKVGGGVSLWRLGKVGKIKSHIKRASCVKKMQKIGKNCKKFAKISKNCTKLVRFGQ